MVFEPVQVNVVLRLCNHLSNRFVVPGGLGEAHHVACSGILAFFGETVGVHKIGVFHPELSSPLIHGFGELSVAFDMIPSEALGDVVKAANKHHFEQSGFLIGAPLGDPDIAWRNLTIGPHHRYFLIELT